MIVRVFCVDGPCRGVHYLDSDTGRVLFSETGRILFSGTSDGKHYIYRVSDDERVGSNPAAYYVGPD